MTGLGEKGIGEGETKRRRIFVSIIMQHILIKRVNCRRVGAVLSPNQSLLFFCLVFLLVP